MFLIVIPCQISLCIRFSHLNDSSKILLIKKWQIKVTIIRKLKSFCPKNRFSRILLILEKYRISHFFRFFQREMKFLSFYTIIQRCTVIFVEPTITFSLAWNPKTIGFGIDFIKEKLYPNFSREISTRESRYHFRENITTRDPRTERNFWKIENEDNWKFIFR